ncbi:MAG: OPT/YSL family transporter [archaeon GB-1867-035]|nr:OPT/YSL family transporter [Candidatus Culexmicrobium profundum]
MQGTAMSRRKAFTVRAALLGMILVTLYVCINGYLGINFGWGFGFGTISIILGYALFHKLFGGSSKGEISTLMIISSSMMGVHSLLGFLLYLSESDPNASLPFWLAPPRDVILSKSLSLEFWLIPISFIILTQLASTFLGLIFALVLSSEFVKSKRMVFPYTAVSASLVDSCFNGSGAAKLVAWSAVIGLIVTFLQYLALFFGIDLTTIDFTPFLPEGFVFAVALSLGFMAIGYIMSSKVSLSVFASGLITYLVISPILVHLGVVEYSRDAMQFYNNLMFNFTISPALGIMILGGFGLSAIFLLKSKLGKKERKADDETLGYAYLFKTLWRGLLSNKLYLMLTLFIGVVFHVAAYVLNPLAPLPPIFSLIFTAYAFFVGSFIELVILTKMSGETGMTMGTTSILLYDLPIFSTGYRGYAAYWALPMLRPSPWATSGVACYVKYKDQFEVDVKDIAKSKIVGWLPSIFVSMIFTIVLWKYIGFGTPMMPAIGLLQQKMYYQMLATGNIAGTVDPVLFVAGGIFGAILELLTPASMIGVAMGMFLPPHYTIPFGVGGLIRLYTDKKFGSKYYDERGRLIATGIMVSSIIVQVVMAIVKSML